MSAIYLSIPTHAGQAKISNALTLGIPLKITHMAVGDGNGQPVTPDPAQTKLVREQRRAPLNTLFQDPLNPAQLVAEQIIPENVGGWWIREVGLYDETGTLIAIANSPDTYKPQLSEGSGRTQTIRMVLIVSDTSAVELKIDPSVVLATRKYVDDVMKSHRESRDHPSATTTDKGMVRKATDEEALLGKSIDAVMSAKNVADAVKEMLKQMFVGVPIPWPSAEPPSWALAMQGQAINPASDPLLAQRYPGLILDDMRKLSIRGFGTGDLIRAKQKGTLVSVEMGSGSTIDGVWNVGSVGGKSDAATRDAVGVDAYDVSEYQGVAMGYANLYAAHPIPGGVAGLATSGIVRVPSRFFNYITMRG